MGYCILHAANGNEVLTVGEEWKGAIHLMVTDVMMPRHERRAGSKNERICTYLYYHRPNWPGTSKNSSCQPLASMIKDR